MSVLRRLRETPRHLLVCEKSNLGHAESRHRQHVERHHYNYRVSLLIPECAVPPVELKNIITDSGPYYLVKNLSLHELINHEFIDTFVKKGSCYALTYNTNIDQDNTVAVLPTGRLILSLDKDTYEELGLQGRPSQYSGRKAMRYSGEESTMMSYFSTYQIQAHQPKITLSTLKDLQCPVLQSNELRGKPEESCSAQEVFDWLGAVFNNVEMDNQSSNFLSTYCCSQPSMEVGKAHLCTITGFILPQTICLILEQLRHYFDEPKFTSWVSLSVQGFADSPVSWRESEHGFQKGGENLYNFVIFSNQDYWLQMAVGANDDCPP
uniref:Ribonuclease P/MRP subunit p40 n=1 Tax=Ornithorhynchus anatinus TaxID=9258 RepID=A0A6I8P3H5_ORNAN